jgi:hypothetical protein
VKLYQLQLVIIAAWLLVGFGMAHFPTIRFPPPKLQGLQKMCKAPHQDELSRGACAEFSAR